MKIAIVAATGRIGHEVLVQARQAGHDVTAVVRSPGKLPPDVKAVRVDLSRPDRAALKAAVAGVDAVLSGLGPRTWAEAGIASPGTAAVIDAMRATGVPRIVVVSAAPVGTVASPGRPHPPHRDPGDGPVTGAVLAPLVKALLRGHYADLALMEDMLRGSGLDWTAVRPPRLTDRSVTGRYRTALDRNVRGGLRIPRADVAHLMLSLLDRPDTIGHTVGIAA